MHSIINDTSQHYYASNKGHIKNSKGLIMKNKINANGYSVILLTNKKNGKKKHLYQVHRLIAYAFIKNDDPVNKNIINHLDSNRKNNNIENLEWTTRRKNNIHGSGIKVTMIHPTKNKILKKFECVADANIFLGLCKKNENIKTCMKNKSKIFHGYRWQFLTNNNIDEDIFVITQEDIANANI